jgi:DNA adenine methylase
VSPDHIDPERGPARPYVSPLRWAGSKKRLLPKLLERAPVQFGRYIEPFAGSSVLFFSLKPRDALLADVNPDLINFYRELRRDPSRLHSDTTLLGNSAKSYLEVRDRYQVERETKVRAALFWSLNRQCFNGLYRTNSRGHFNVPRGSHLSPFPTLTESREWANKLHSSDLLVADFSRTVSNASAGDFVYMDPPYARLGARDRGEYGHGAMQPQEISLVVEAAHRAARKGAAVLLSYNQDLSLLLRGWNAELVNVRHSISATPETRHIVSEFLFWNY